MTEVDVHTYVNVVSLTRKIPNCTIIIQDDWRHWAYGINVDNKFVPYAEEIKDKETETVKLWISDEGAKLLRSS